MDDYLECIRENLQDDFEVGLFDTSVRLLDDKSNQTRFNNFSTNIRELLRHVFKRLAPENEVMQCVWYSNELENKKGTNRTQRMLYAIKGGLSDEFIDTELNVETNEIIHEVKYVIDKLNKYTHVTEETFNVSQDEGNELVDKTMEAIVLFFDTIEKLRDKVAGEYKNYIDPVMRDVFIEKFPSELDKLATHCYVEDVEVRDILVEDITSSVIKMKTKGIVYVEQQYGSNSDQKNGDGFACRGSYPFKVSVDDEACNPKNIKIGEVCWIKINTDSFYGDT